MSEADRCDWREAFTADRASWLGSYAVSESDAGPRKYPEDPHAYRTCFQRDRDRVVHCSAFRRLDFKTQVFVPHEHDHFRTRLTHTLEVAQIGRDIGRALRLNEDLIEAVALAHDLGHSPFGHAGEAALDELMAGHGGFEHNRQSLRVVDHLEHPYPNFRGLNLTSVVRECLAKHKTAYDSPICEQFDNSLQSPLEGQLVDLSDEIAYTCADLEDSLEAGLINTEELSQLELWQMAYHAAKDAFPQARPIHKRIRAIKVALGLLADDLIETTIATIRANGIDSPDSARKAGKKCVVMTDKTAAMFEGLRGFLYENVYLNEKSRVHAQRATKTIGDLFTSYVNSPDLLPKRYAKRVDSEGLQRVVCDYIAGMTDRFCLAAHERICS